MWQEFLNDLDRPRSLYTLISKNRSRNLKEALNIKCSKKLKNPVFKFPSSVVDHQDQLLDSRHRILAFPNPLSGSLILRRFPSVPPDTNSAQFQWDAPLQSTLQHTAKPSISQSIVALSGFFTWDHLPHCTALISCTAASFWTLKIDTVPHYRAPTHPTEVRSRLKSETFPFDRKTTLTTNSSGVFLQKC